MTCFFIVAAIPAILLMLAYAMFLVAKFRVAEAFADVWRSVARWL